MTQTWSIAAIALVALAGCSEDAPPPAAPAKAASLQAGEYDIAWTVGAVTSADNSTPATALKAGGTSNVRTCVGDGKLDPQAFAEAGDSCTEKSSYVRGGRLNLELACRREGEGDIGAMVDGKFTADSFSGTLTSATYFSGPGDYRATRTFEAKRVGDCPPAVAPKP